MKPIFIVVDKENNKVSFDANEFKKVCNDIYQQGYTDGYCAGKNSYYWYCSSPTISADKITLTPGTTTEDHHWWDDINITCSSNTTKLDNTLHKMPTESNDCIKGSRFDNN